MSEKESTEHILATGSCQKAPPESDAEAYAELLDEFTRRCASEEKIFFPLKHLGPVTETVLPEILLPPFMIPGLWQGKEED